MDKGVVYIYKGILVKWNSKEYVWGGSFRWDIRLQEKMKNRECCKYVAKTP